MSLYRDALAALKSIVIIDERLQALARKADEMAVEVRGLNDRVTRLEAIIEVVRPDGLRLRVLPPEETS